MANNPAGTYYVSQAGAGDGSGSSVANARSVANHNGDTWNAPSVIYLLDTITSGLIPPSSGTSDSSRIVYRGDYTGHACTFDMAAGATSPIFINGKSYITVTQMTLSNSSANLVAFGGTTNYITLSYLTLSQGTAARDIQYNAGSNLVIDHCTFNQGDGIAFLVAAASTAMSITNNTFNGTAGKTPAQCLYIYTVTGLTFTGNTLTDWTLGGASYLVYLRSVTGGTLSSNTIGTAGHGNTGVGYYCQASTSLTFTGDIVTDSTSVGWLIDATSTATLTSCQALSCGSYGFQCLNNTSFVNCTSDGNTGGFVFTGGTNTATGCSAINSVSNGTGFYNGAATTTLTNCTAYSNQEDGFSSNLTGTMTCNRCLSHTNGLDAQATSGDGFTSHNSSVMNVYNSVAYNNLKSGIAITGTGNSNIYNNSLYNNYSLAKAGTGGGIYSTKTGGTQNIKNNVTAGHDLETNVAGAGATYNMDYNCYNNTGATAFSGGTWAAWQLLGYDAHGVNVDPKWLSTVTPDFHLTTASPYQVRTGGANVGLTTDYEGNGVPYAGGYPMGAYRSAAMTSGLSLGLGLSGGNRPPWWNRRR